MTHVDDRYSGGTTNIGINQKAPAQNNSDTNTNPDSNATGSQPSP